jgi:hypothetical protein
VQQGVSHPCLLKYFNGTIEGVAFAEGAKVESRSRMEKADRMAVGIHLHLVPTDCCLKICIRLRWLGVLSGGEPWTDGGIEIAVGEPGQLPGPN